MTCRDNRDGSCAVEYFPTKKGDYDISVKFADEHIPGSPFTVKIADEINPSKVRIAESYPFNILLFHLFLM